MGIFKKITKALKKAAPVIGAGIGMYYGGAGGAALGSGIGSLAGGRSAEEALRNAALAGGAAYLAGGSGFGQKVEGQDYFSKDTFDFGKSPVAGLFGGGGSGEEQKAVNKVISTGSDSSGIMDFVKDNKMLTASLAGGALGLMSAEEKEIEDAEQRAFAEGSYRGGTLMTEDDDGKMVYFDGSDPEERQAYLNQIRKNNEEKSKREVVTDYDKYGIRTVAAGGEVNGPGTGTSDSVPARLSDGEFVVTAKAVRGAGGGDRNVGAARMYDMMSQLERVA